MTEDVQAILFNLYLKKMFAQYQNQIKSKKKEKLGSIERNSIQKKKKAFTWVDLVGLIQYKLQNYSKKKKAMGIFNLNSLVQNAFTRKSYCWLFACCCCFFFFLFLKVYDHRQYSVIVFTLLYSTLL